MTRAATPLQVVWFKRDLRIHDHQPLAQAARSGGAVLPLYVAEPALWCEPDRSARHRDAVRVALHDLDRQLRGLGASLVVAPGEAVETFEALYARFGVFRLLAHEETGNAWTYRRDVAVADWCRARGVAFEEVPQFGVIRRLRRRDGWARRWDAQMAQPLTPPPPRLRAAPPPPGFGGVECVGSDPGERPAPAMQALGRRAALADLDSFLKRRAHGYRVNMSSPLRAETGGSRLSVHLSLGTLAMREVWQATRHRRLQQRGRPAARTGQDLDADLAAFEGRLHWHCHFMQKLESEPRMEFENLSAATDGLREAAPDPARLATWTEGRTGYPYVDACMRFLHHSGWLNFRARAMLMSFASYDLWLPWREPALHLARLFLDYEPGIHYPQVQMQSGTTGINSVRIYNPVKQGEDHDPEGSFIARWVPELANLPAPRRHRPWELSPAEQVDAGVVLGRDYPQRVVEHARAARAALAAIQARRRGRGAREEAAAIHAQHGSRRRR